MTQGHSHDPRMGLQRPELNAPVSDIVLAAGESPGPAARRAADGGMAALVLGAVVTLLAPLTLLATILMAAHGPQGLHMNRTEVTLGTMALVVCSILVFLLGIAGLIFAVLSLGAARRSGQPLALNLAGVFLNAVGLVLFLLVFIDLVFVLVRFNREAR